MPSCKNGKGSYKGSEPSPKGVGFCAKHEKIGTRKRGKDKKMWIVRSVKYKSGKRIRRWFLVQKPKTKPKSSKRKATSHGPKSNQSKRAKQSKVLTKDNDEFKKIKHTGYKRYYTHFNGGRPFLVYLGKKDAYIYEKPSDDVEMGNNWSRQMDENKWMYIKLVKHINFIKSFVGKSPLNRMTKNSGGHGKYFDGNTILLQTSKTNYVFIYNSIDNFKLDDKIIEFVSPVGNNDVPYPYVIGEKYIVGLHYPWGYIQKKYFTNISNSDKLMDQIIKYSPFFIPFGKKKTKHGMSIEKFEEIRNKPLSKVSKGTLRKIAKMYSVVSSGSKQQVADTIERVRGITVYNK
jgi:hypothetical protein